MSKENGVGKHFHEEDVVVINYYRLLAGMKQRLYWRIFTMVFHYMIYLGLLIIGMALMFRYDVVIGSVVTACNIVLMVTLYPVYREYNIQYKAVSEVIKELETKKQEEEEKTND